MFTHAEGLIKGSSTRINARGRKGRNPRIVSSAIPKKPPRIRGAWELLFPPVSRGILSYPRRWSQTNGRIYVRRRYSLFSPSQDSSCSKANDAVYSALDNRNRYIGYGWQNSGRKVVRIQLLLREQAPRSDRTPNLRQCRTVARMSF